MTKGSKLHEGAAAKMRSLAARFEKELSAAIPAPTRSFQRSLLLRPQNPFNGHDRRILTRGIAASDLQVGPLPGLYLPLSVFNDSARLIDLETPAMREKGQKLIVFRDLTAIYVEEVEASSDGRMVRALPTPLKFRNKHRHLALNESLTFGAKRGQHGVYGNDDPVLGLVLGGDCVAARGWTAGEDPRYAPLGTELTREWLAQFEAEIAFLSRRLAQQSPLRATFVSAETVAALPIVTGQGSISRLSWFLRPEMTDDDMHLGGITFDPQDPVLLTMQEAFEIALALSHAEVAPDYKEVFLDVRAASPFERYVGFTFSGRSAGANEAIGYRIMDLIPREILDIANRYTMITPDSIERQMFVGHMAIIRVDSRQPLPSNHARIEMLGRLRGLIQEILCTSKVSG